MTSFQRNHAFLLLFFLLLFSLFATDLYANSISKNQEQSENGSELWVLVLNDPRPPRFRKQRATHYNLPKMYDKDKSLKRLRLAITKEYGLESVADWPISSLGVYCLIVKALEPSEQLDDFKQTVSNDIRIKWVQTYNKFYGLMAEENMPIQRNFSDPYYPLQSAFKQLQLDRLPQHLDGDGMSVAIIDSGVDLSHRDFKGARIQYSNYVSSSDKEIQSDPIAESHGTAIASILIAQSDNDVGIVGVIPAVKLFALRGCWQQEARTTSCDTLSLARSLDAVVRLKPDILNLSLTGPEDQLLEAIIDKIIMNGTYIVAAFDERRSFQRRFPKLRTGVNYARRIPDITNNMNKNRTQQVQQMQQNYWQLPGDQIITAQPKDNYEFLSGNSLSAAYLTSIAILLKQHDPELAQELFNIKDKHQQKDLLLICHYLEKRSNPCTSTGTN